MSMRVAFRADAGIAIGSGHVMRCATLAKALLAAGAEVRFICREQAGDLCDWLESQGYAVDRLPPSATAVQGDLAHSAWLGASQAEDAQQTLNVLPDVDWLVVDHYGIDARWETPLRQRAGRLLVVDDLADRQHDCDILLDQNYRRDGNDRYQGRVPGHCMRLLGPRYALLRPEFSELRRTMQTRTGEIRRILVFLGGADRHNHTSKVLDALDTLNRKDLQVDVVVGAANPWRSEIEHRCQARGNTRFLCQIPDLAALMAEADLAIGAGGGSNWERAALAMPSVVLSIADNQRAIVQDLTRDALVMGFVDADSLGADVLAGALSLLFSSPDLCLGMGERFGQLCDGGGCERVISAMAGGVAVRSAEMADAETMFAWRNDPSVRANSLDASPLRYEEHLQWLTRALLDPQRDVLMALRDGREVGVLRFDISGTTARVSIYLAPGQTGKGLGGAILRAGEAWLAQRRPNVDVLNAEVLSGNLASIQLFERNGYRWDHAIYTKHLERRS